MRLSLIIPLVCSSCGSPQLVEGPAGAHQERTHHYKKLEDCPYGSKDWQYYRANAGDDGWNDRETRKTGDGTELPAAIRYIIEEAEAVHRREHRSAFEQRSGHSLDSGEGRGS